MNLNEFAKEIHANACDKGFWDEPRPFDELCALMISELSEALEEARAGRAMEYEINGKPEGIAVEMADCAIRIMDYLGSVEYELGDISATPFINNLSVTFMEAAGQIVNARLFMRYQYEALAWDKLAVALEYIVSWFVANGLDFEAIARRKHEYNKTRPRLHGKLF